MSKVYLFQDGEGLFFQKPASFIEENPNFQSLHGNIAARWVLDTSDFGGIIAFMSYLKDRRTPMTTITNIVESLGINQQDLIDHANRVRK